MPARERAWDGDDAALCLSEPQREVARQLGCGSRAAWEDGEAVVWTKGWAELSRAQQRAAAELDYDEVRWSQVIIPHHETFRTTIQYPYSSTKDYLSTTALVAGRRQVGARVARALARRGLGRIVALHRRSSTLNRNH